MRQVRTVLTIGALVIVGVIIAMQSLLGNIAAEQLKAWLGPWIAYVPYAFLVITVGLIGFTLRDQLSKPTPGASESTIDLRQAERNRRAMLENVWRTWIEGVLQDSLYKETLIALGLQSRPDAVRPPRNAIVQRPQQADQLLPPDTPILQVFDNSHGALLILGVPGSGKTTLLLELARDLQLELAGECPSRHRCLLTNHHSTAMWSEKLPCVPGMQERVQSTDRADDHCTQRVR